MLYCPNCHSSKVDCSQMITTNPPIPVYKCYDCGHEFEQGITTLEAPSPKILLQEEAILKRPQLWKLDKIDHCTNYFNNGGKYLVPAELYEHLVEYIKATKDDALLFLKNIGEE